MPKVKVCRMAQHSKRRKSKDQILNLTSPSTYNLLFTFTAGRGKRGPYNFFLFFFLSSCRTQYELICVYLCEFVANSFLLCGCFLPFLRCLDIYTLVIYNKQYIGNEITGDQHYTAYQHTGHNKVNILASGSCQHDRAKSRP